MDPEGFGAGVLVTSGGVFSALRSRFPNRSSCRSVVCCMACMAALMESSSVTSRRGKVVERVMKKVSNRIQPGEGCVAFPLAWSQSAIVPGWRKEHNDGADGAKRPKPQVPPKTRRQTRRSLPGLNQRSWDRAESQRSSQELRAV